MANDYSPDRTRPAVPELVTDRLLLRGWRDTDRDPWAEMNADPQVRRFFPDTLTREQSDASIERFRAGFAERGYGLWATQERATGAFIGFVGLNPIPVEYPSAPGTEIGWRLAQAFWGRGYAPEAARAVLDFAFGPAGLTDLVSFTTEANAPSRRVMEKIGMVRDPAGDFDHPNTPGWWGAPHVLYRISRPGSS